MATVTARKLNLETLSSNQRSTARYVSALCLFASCGTKLSNMTQKGQLPPPPVMWAQREDILFVTICLEDCKDPILKIEPEMIYFKGIGGTEQKMHEVTINLYKEIDVNKTVQHIKGRTLELILTKKESGPFWPRLTKEKMKVHWLKSDFNKWKDEDDSDDDVNAGGSTNLEDMVQQMGGLGHPVNSKPDFDGLDYLGDEAEEMDSDDDDLPDLID
ncbi:LOW QUALITY PROTEIN: prostaglandin E synthase 3 [Hylaeus anthracinus]|uniref:LOW QUALITY PROTEIN: prostaglandin E synthase 3 n=1 Tax=Hylaeus volcanicus TaxID=313075 RepID=UPI0023B78CA8|nr:LOW QUALITY PROTEIN: prostaglandin E synthase 3 [Hylaeus volcanicus]XP_054002237.1 LOW QUALITY PROTEIN: prostaglandin E synthase 3 [Hylaeus anthracinus]